MFHYSRQQMASTGQKVGREGVKGREVTSRGGGKSLIGKQTLRIVEFWKKGNFFEHKLLEPEKSLLRKGENGRSRRH